MKITFFGGPRDGEVIHVDPTNPESDKLPVPTVWKGPMTQRLHTDTKHYWLHVPTAQYIWCDTHWPLDK